MSPYEETKDDLAARLRDNGLTQVLHNLPAGDWAGGERGIAILPDRVEEFRRGVHRRSTMPSALGCRQLNCLVGLTPEGHRRRHRCARRWSPISPTPRPSSAKPGSSC